MPPKKPDYDKLIVTRENITSKLSRFEEYLQQFETNISLTQLKIRLNKLDEIWKDFEGVQTEIERCPTVDQHQERIHRQTFEDKYFNLSTMAEELIIKHTDASTHSNVSVQPEFLPVPQQQMHVKLPMIDLPKFNGRYDQWVQFHDTFKTLIHDITTISTIEKFHYLKSSLQGDAAQIIESLSITSENYAVAWNLIIKRYQNKRLIVYNHVNSLLEIPTLSKESYLALRQLTDNFLKHFRALEALKQPVHNWNGIIIPLLTSKFDINTKREWEMQQNSSELPELEDLISFLNKRCQILEASYSNTKSEIKNTFINKTNKVTSHVTINNTRNTAKCPFCKGPHYIYNCNNFLNLSNYERLKEIKNLKLCTNCFRDNHFSKDCRSTSCKICTKRHNTLLHIENSSVGSVKTNPETATTEQQHGAVATCCSVKSISQVLLSTAIIQIHDASNQIHECRALLDSGSQSHFMTQRLCTKLNLPYHNIQSNFPVSGIALSNTTIKKCTQAKIKSRFNGFRTTIKCLILPTITENIPNVAINSASLKIPSNIKLADPTYNTPGEVDLLLGADLFYHLLSVGQILLGQNNPILQKTKLGWIVSGTIDPQQRDIPQTTCFLNINKNLENQIAKFWNIEEFEDKTHYSKTELQAEQHFISNTTRASNGRYMVRLPINESADALGDSYDRALNRFYALETRLIKNPSLKVEYVKFMREYESLNHMSIVDSNSVTADHTYYLPHHAVIKQTSSTTKVRVVFDGSAKTTTNTSLNDTLLVGPTIQQDLYSILIRFRTYQVVLTADIEKMYRQVEVHPDHRNLQRILWREDLTEPLKIYTLNTVTYGTSAAPFLAVRTLKQLALDDGHLNTKAAKVLLENFYVDDCLTGASTLNEAKQLKQELIELLSKGQFNLHKWNSNHKELLDADHNHERVSLILDHEQPVKTLGLFWNSANDTLQYSVNYQQSKRICKREILSIIAQIFDPLGLLGPVIINFKLIMQQLWQLGLDWDETLPISIHTKWLNLYKDLNSINQIKIARLVMPSTSTTRIELHGFSDASESAYGACIYIKTYNGNNTYVSLITSKSRVAPLKTLTIPRLELCAVLLLSKLSKTVRIALSLNIDQIYHWTDSSIALAWIQSSPHLLKQFIANRVSKIQQLSEGIQWRHIPSQDNPADILSRGITPSLLSEKDIWWNGPNWLKQPESQWPNLNFQVKFTHEELETKRCINLVTRLQDFSILDRYSSFIKFKNVIAWCYRFTTNASNGRPKNLGPLTIQEFNHAETVILKLLQLKHFKEELNALKLDGVLDKSSNLRNLSPFLDQQGLIRVGGRLKCAFIPYNQKHPIILPKNSNITTSIIQEEHTKRFHCGPQSLLSFIRLKYWPISARTTIRKITRNCVSCFRCNPQPATHVMGNLPEARITQGNRPFFISGVDYCGPFNIIESKRRGRKIVSKYYVAIFICFSTKAVHLEPVSELTGEAFLATLKRFTARRGLCSELHSDNGTNFVKANNDLQQLYTFLRQQNNHITSQLAAQNIIWHFNPPRSPHFGGLWESAVKLFKFHFKRVLNLNLTYEEFLTVTTQIEAIINSRPLIPLSSNPDDLTPITPAHFLIGDSLIAPIESDLSTKREHLLTRWEHLQQIRQHFWQRWSLDYLHSLQPRNKWNHGTNNLAVGSLVLLIDDNTPPQQWKTGRITQLHPGSDSIVRVVTLKTNSGVFKRAVRKICILPNQFDN